MSTFGLAINNTDGDIILHENFRFTRYVTTYSATIVSGGTHNKTVPIVGMVDDGTWMVVMQWAAPPADLKIQTGGFYIDLYNPYLETQLVNWVVVRV